MDSSGPAAPARTTGPSMSCRGGAKWSIGVPFTDAAPAPAGGRGESRAPHRRGSAGPDRAWRRALSAAARAATPAPRGLERRSRGRGRARRGGGGAPAPPPPPPPPHARPPPAPPGRGARGAGGGGPAAGEILV